MLRRVLVFVNAVVAEVVVVGEDVRVVVSVVEVAVVAAVAVEHVASELGVAVDVEVAPQ